MRLSFSGYARCEKSRSLGGEYGITHECVDLDAKTEHP